MIFNDSKHYDILKIIALNVAPLIVFITAVIEIWGIPYGPQITATLAALDVLVGAIVTNSKKMYDKRQKGGTDAK